MCSTVEGVKYERGTLSVRTRVKVRTGTSSIRRRHIISMNAGVQHGEGSPVQTYIFSTDADLPGDPKKNRISFS